MLLPDIVTSTERVALRIAQKGHFIDSESIKYNFEQGLVMLKKHFNIFDTLEITESSLNNDLAFPKRLLMLKNNNVIFIEPNAPKWAKPILDEIVQKLTTN